MKRLLTILLLFISGISFAGSQLDSLEKTLVDIKHDSTKINALLEWKNKLSPAQQELKLEVDKKVLSIAEKNLKKSNLKKNEIQFFKSRKGRSINRIGLSYLMSSDYSKAIGNFTKALKIFKEVGDQYEIANCYSNLGVSHIYKGNYPQALEFSLKAMKLREEINDTMNLAASYNNVAYLYTVLKKYELSLEFNEKALEIYKKLKMEQDVGGVYINMGILYRNMNENRKALEFYLMALPIKEKGKDKGKLGDLYNNISVVYSSLNDHEKSLQYAAKALALHEEIKNNIGISGSLANLASSYFELHRYREAKKSLERSLPLAKSVNHKMTIAHIYLSLTQVDSALGDYKSSLFNYKKYITYRDSLFSEENTRKEVEAQMKYEFGKDSVANAKQKQLDKALIEKQHSEISAQKSEKDFMKKLQIIVFIVLVMAVIFGIFMYNRFRVTSRQKNIIEKQKQEVEFQKHIVDEKQKEILDSINYAQRLQQAILTPESEIKKHFPESFLFYKPKDIVAGDFYFFEKHQHFIYYAAADCTGHGVPGAMVSVVCANALSRCVKEFGLTDPGKILDKTRELVVETFLKSGDEIRDGMDISFCVFDTRNSIVKWSGANNPLWICRAKTENKLQSKGQLTYEIPTTVFEPTKLQVTTDIHKKSDSLTNEYLLYEIAADKQAIGHIENPRPYTSHELHLHSGDSIYLFTDGYKDQFGGTQGKKLKAFGFKQIILSLQGQPMKKQSEELEYIFNEWHNPSNASHNRSYEQLDDVCVIGIKI